MNGSGPIVLRLENHSFHEHSGIEAATREAERLALGQFSSDSAFVVYVPVLRVQKPRPVEVISLISGREVQDIIDTELPF